MSLRDYKLWEKAAEDFIRFIDRMGKNGHGDYLRKHLLLPAVKEAMGDVSGKKILDAGCGEGVLTEVLEDMGGIVIGVDSSERMIVAANNRKNRKKLEAEFVQGSVTDQLFDTETFDIVVLNMLLQEIEQAEESFNLLYSYVKPGGIIVLSVLHPAFDMNASQAKALGDLDGKIKERAVLTYELSAPYSTEARYERNYTFSEHPIPYYFRSLMFYVNLFINKGMRITTFNEPTLSSEKMKYSRHRHAYFLPRFVIIGGEKT